MKNPRPKDRTAWWQVALAIPLAPVLLAVVVFLIALFVVVALPVFVVASVCLHITIWTWWCLRGRDILFVYSDSPIWHEYIEQRILPHLGERAAVLNWSQHKRWRLSLATLAFHYFGGGREFNPLAVVFRPLRRSRTFRFWQPFRDFKHGRPEALHQMESEFFGVIGVQRIDA